MTRLHVTLLLPKPQTHIARRMVGDTDLAEADSQLNVAPLRQRYKT